MKNHSLVVFVVIGVLTSVLPAAYCGENESLPDAPSASAQHNPPFPIPIQHYLVRESLVRESVSNPTPHDDRIAKPPSRFNRVLNLTYGGVRIGGQIAAAMDQGITAFGINKEQRYYVIAPRSDKLLLWSKGKMVEVNPLFSRLGNSNVAGVVTSGLLYHAWFDKVGQSLYNGERACQISRQAIGYIIRRRMPGVVCKVEAIALRSVQLKANLSEFENWVGMLRHPNAVWDGQRWRRF